MSLEIPQQNNGEDLNKISNDSDKERDARLSAFITEDLDVKDEPTTYGDIPKRYLPDNGTRNLLNKMVREKFKEDLGEIAGILTQNKETAVEGEDYEKASKLRDHLDYLKNEFNSGKENDFIEKNLKYEKEIDVIKYFEEQNRGRDNFKCKILKNIQGRVFLIELDKDNEQSFEIGFKLVDQSIYYRYNNSISSIHKGTTNRPTTLSLNVPNGGSVGNFYLEENKIFYEVKDKNNHIIEKRDIDINSIDSDGGFKETIEKL